MTSQQASNWGPQWVISKGANLETIRSFTLMRVE